MNRFSIKYILFLMMGMMLSVAVSAQKDVRKNIRKGNKEYRQEKFSDAAKFYGNAMEENAASKEANFNFGNALYRQNEWDQAITYQSKQARFVFPPYKCLIFRFSTLMLICRYLYHSIIQCTYGVIQLQHCIIP